MDIPGTGADANAMQRLWDQHAAALWRYAWRLTGDSAHAEDVMQETLLRAWQHPHVLNNGQSPRGWLFTVARNMVIDTKTNHILSMAFEYGPVPANAPPPVAGRPALGPPVPGSFTLLMVGK